MDEETKREFDKIWHKISELEKRGKITNEDKLVQELEKITGAQQIVLRCMTLSPVILHTETFAPQRNILINYELEKT